MGQGVVYARCALVLNVAGGVYPACGNNRAKRSRGGTWNTVWLCRARQLKAIRRKSLLKLAASEEDGLVVLFFDLAGKIRVEKVLVSCNRAWCLRFAHSSRGQAHTRLRP